MALKLIAPPSEEPVSLAEARAQCRIDGADEDGLLAALIMAAREQAEHATGRAFVTQTWELVQDAFPPAFVLRRPPIISLVSVKFLDLSGALQTLDPADTLLDLDSEPGYLVPAYGKTWPESCPIPNAVRVRYTCGYGAAASVPQSLKQWMLLAIATAYAQRETVMAGNVAVMPRAYWEALLDPYRIYEAA